MGDTSATRQFPETYAPPVTLKPKQETGPNQNTGAAESRQFPETYTPPVTLKPKSGTQPPKETGSNVQSNNNDKSNRQFPETYAPPLTLRPKKESDQDQDAGMATSTNPRDQPYTLSDVPSKEDLTTMLEERFPSCKSIETNIDALRIYECSAGKRPARLSAPHGIVRCACIPRASTSDPWTGTTHNEILGPGQTVPRSDKPKWGEFVHFSDYTCDKEPTSDSAESAVCEVYSTTRTLFLEAVKNAESEDAVTDYMQQKLEALNNPLFVAKPNIFTPLIDALWLEKSPKVLRELYHVPKHDQFDFTPSQLRFLTDLQLVLSRRSTQIDLSTQDLLDNAGIVFPDTWSEYVANVLKEEEQSITAARAVAAENAPPDSASAGSGAGDPSLYDKAKNLMSNKHAGMPGWAIALIGIAALVILIAIIAAVVRASSRPKQTATYAYAPGYPPQQQFQQPYNIRG